MKFKHLLICAIFFIQIKTLEASDAGEHALIGNIAFERSSHGYLNEIKNLEADISFSYGQLVAMSGDMYVSVEEISLNDPGILNGFFNRNRKSLKRCIDIEISNIRTKDVYSGCDDLEFAKKKLHYVTLAHDNYSHFAWHNIKRYIELHTQALWFANLAYLKCTREEKNLYEEKCKTKQVELEKLVNQSTYRKRQKSKYRRFPKLFPRKRFTKAYFLKMPKEKMIRLALFANAFADHYLTDSFSAGHLRIPRSQIDKFVENYEGSGKGNRRDKGSSLSGALTQYLHNLDGSLTGIPVTNSLGNKFLIRSDKQLFSKLNSKELSGIVENNKQIQQPVNATSDSIKELFNVISYGSEAIPSGVFKALEHVPYLESQSQNSLEDRVNSHIKEHGTIKKALKSMSSEMQIIYRGQLIFEDISYKKYFRDFVSSIPIMMNELRKQVNNESKESSMSKRIPPPLLTALKNLH